MTPRLALHRPVGETHRPLIVQIVRKEIEKLVGR